jgi:PAS domain S-box-containing protein
MNPTPTGNACFFHGTGFASGLNQIDWADHPLGGPEDWPAPLKTTVDTVLNCGFPMCVAWGPHLLMVYNEAYSLLLGSRHPAAIGQPMQQSWPGIWSAISPAIAQALGGTSSCLEDIKLPLQRSGQADAGWFTFSYSPVHTAERQVGGILCIVTETTGSVVLKNRQGFRLELLEQLGNLSEPKAITAAASALLAQHLGGSRVFYASVDAEAGTFCVQHDWTDGRLSSMTAHVGRLDDFGPRLIAEARAGRTSAISNTATDVRTRDTAQAHADIGLHALLNVPLVKGGRLVAALSVHHIAPYEWTRADISIAEDTAQHTWAALERAQVENELKAQINAEAGRLRELFELSPTAVALVVGKAHVFEFVNEAFCRMVGRWDMVGKPVSQALSDVVEQGLEGVLDQVLATGKPYVASGIAIRLQPDPGEPAHTIYVDLVYQPRIGRDGQVTGIFAQAHDITEAYQAQSALRQSEARFRAAVSAIGIMWTNNAAGEMQGPQPGWTAVTGQSEADYSGFGWSRMVHPEDAEATVEAWRTAVRQRSIFSFEHRLRTVRRGWRLFSIRAVPILQDNGTITEWVGVHIDITDARQAEEALKETDRRKDEFLATLAHELRNPLAPIRTAAHVLDSDRQLTDAQRTHLHDIISRQASIMTLLLDDLLDVSRISNGRFELRRASVELKTVVETAIEAARPLIDAKHHRFMVVTPQEALVVHADALRLSQVLTNLLTNAAKYTDQGGQLSLTLVRDDAGISIAVKDNGIGIDPQSLPHIFTMFSQVKSVIDRSEGGLGIGLSLARGLVRLHGGTIYAHSEGPGRGSEVTVHLPLDLLQPAGPDAVGTDPGRSEVLPKPEHALSVMVVDDNVDAAGTFAMMLRLDGY